MRNAMGQCRIDGVLGDVTLGSSIVVVHARNQQASLHLHFMRCLPCSDNHLSDPTHGLRIRSNHREGAQIVQDILRRDGFFTDTRVSECNIFRNVGIKVMTHHQHI